MCTYFIIIIIIIIVVVVSYYIWVRLVRTVIALHDLSFFGNFSFIFSDTWLLI
jgi:hypothetical protein